MYFLHFSCFCLTQIEFLIGKIPLHTRCEKFTLPSLSAKNPTKGGARKMVNGKMAYIKAICSTLIPISFIWMVKYGKIENADAEKKNSVNFNGSNFLFIVKCSLNHVFFFFSSVSVFFKSQSLTHWVCIKKRGNEWLFGHSCDKTRLKFLALLKNVVHRS